jgi:hypothetical protein
MKNLVSPDAGQRRGYGARFGMQTGDVKDRCTLELDV